MAVSFDGNRESTSTWFAIGLVIGKRDSCSWDVWEIYDSEAGHGTMRRQIYSIERISEVVVE